MSSENIFDILERNNLKLNGMNYSMYEDFSKTIDNEIEIIEKIKDYEKYMENNNNRYSEEIMYYLRQRQGLGKYDYSLDEQLMKMSPNETFQEVIRWNGLLGSYADTIKSWVKEIYGVNLDEIELKIT